MSLTARLRATRPAGAGIVIGVALIATVATAHGPLAAALEHIVSRWQNGFAQATSGQNALPGWHVYAVAFTSRLLASLSPCILGMLPVNLSYIGARPSDLRGWRSQPQAASWLALSR